MKDLYTLLHGEELFAATIRENVSLQLDHLKTHTAVATGLRRGDLRLHKWVYSIGTGDMWVYDWEKKSFIGDGKPRSFLLEPGRGMLKDFKPDQIMVGPIFSLRSRVFCPLHGLDWIYRISAG